MLGAIAAMLTVLSFSSCRTCPTREPSQADLKALDELIEVGNDPSTHGVPEGPNFIAAVRAHLHQASFLDSEWLTVVIESNEQHETNGSYTRRVQAVTAALSQVKKDLERQIKQ